MTIKNRGIGGTWEKVVVAAVGTGMLANVGAVAAAPSGQPETAPGSSSEGFLRVTGIKPKVDPAVKKVPKKLPSWAEVKKIVRESTYALTVKNTLGGMDGETHGRFTPDAEHRSGALGGSIRSGGQNYHTDATWEADKATFNVGVNWRTGEIVGPFNAGVTQTKEVVTANPLDPRLEGTDPGTQLVKHTLTGTLAAGASGEVPVGGLPVTLGARADGSARFSLGWTKLEKDSELFTMFQLPRSLSQAKEAIRPGEGFRKSGAQSIAFGGSVKLGYGTQGAKVTAGGSVLLRLTGNLDIEWNRDQANPDLWRVSVKKLSGKSTVEAFTAELGVDAGGLPTAGLLKKAAKPIEKAAKIGVEYSMEQLTQNGAVIQGEIDTRTPAGQKAMDAAQRDDYSWALLFSGYADSGVKMTSGLQTHVEADSEDFSAHVGKLTIERATTMLDRTDVLNTPGAVQTFKTLDRASSHKTQPLRPMGIDRKIRIVGVVDQTKELPPFDGSLTPALPPMPKLGEKTLESHRSALELSLKVETKSTSVNELYGRLSQTLRLLDTLKVAKPDNNIKDLQDALAGGLKPKPKSWPLGINDNTAGKIGFTIGGTIGQEGLHQALAPDGVLRPKLEFFRGYLDVTGALDAPVSMLGAKHALARTLGAALTDTPKGVEVFKDGKVIGTFTTADLECIRDILTGHVGDDYTFKGDGIGTFVGERPAELVALTSSQWGNSEDLVEYARLFADTAQKAQALWAENQPPVQRAGESDSTFQARRSHWEETSLYRNPAEYAKRMEGLIRDFLDEDPTTFGALALMKLAGPDNVRVHAAVDVEASKVGQMLETGAKNVREFAATRLLVASKAALDKETDVITLGMPQGVSLEQVKAAAKTLFPEAKVEMPFSSTKVVQITVDEYKNDDQKQALWTLLIAGEATKDGDVVIPSTFTLEEAWRMAAAAGKNAWVRQTPKGDYRLVYDNLGHKHLQITAAQKAVSTTPLPLMWPDQSPAGEQPSADTVGASFKVDHVGPKSATPGFEILPGVDEEQKLN